MTVGGVNVGEQPAGIDNHDHGSEGVTRAFDDRVDLRRIGGIGDDRHHTVSHGSVDIGNEVVTTGSRDGEVLPAIQDLSCDAVSSNATVHDQHNRVGATGTGDCWGMSNRCHATITVADAATVMGGRWQSAGTIGRGGICWAAMSTTLDDDARCPCGTGLTLAECCGSILRGERRAPTAEALMRSRFTAFAVGDRNHLLRSWHPDTRPADLTVDDSMRWLRLDVESVSGGGPFDTTGTVEFTAFYRAEGRRGQMHELSTFTRLDGSWVYVDGAVD